MQNSSYTLDSTFIFNNLSLLRSKKPLIHNITNFVAMQIIANSLLAIGASPIMAHSKNELAEIIQIADALVINIGTLDEVWVKSITYAQQLANTKSIPIIFDPVGAGATKCRTHIAHVILKNGIKILRGNAPEIMKLVDDTIVTKGVNSICESIAAIHAASILAKRNENPAIATKQIKQLIEECKTSC